MRVLCGQSLQPINGFSHAPKRRFNLNEESDSKTPLAPAAIGPYWQAVEARDMIFCSGQLGLDPGTGGLVAGGTGREWPHLIRVPAL